MRCQLQERQLLLSHHCVGVIERYTHTLTFAHVHVTASAHCTRAERLEQKIRFFTQLACTQDVQLRDRGRPLYATIR